VRLLEEKGTTDLQGDESRRRFLQTVIEALGRIGPAAAAAVPALMKKTKDANRLVSQSAANALGRIVPASLK
jgi:HEAT repeat protein